MPDLLWASQPDGSTTWYNQGWLDYTGQRLEEAIGWGWTDTIHPDDQDASAKRYGQAVAAGQSLRQEHRIRRHDGVYRWFVVSASPLKDSTGQVVKMYGAATDIHDRKLGEQALATELANTTLLSELGARLVTEENRTSLYEAILSAAITITQADGGTVQVYDPATKELVLLVTRHFERRITDYFHRVGADSQTACGIALKTGQRTFVDFDDNQTDIACQMHVDAGYLSAQSTPLVSRKGQPIGMLNTHWRQPRHRPSASELRFLDLLARQTADFIEQRQTEEALRLADQRKDEFLAMLAHELRNPMATLRSGLQILSLATGGGERSHHTVAESTLAESTVAMMNRQTDHLVRMVDDLLDVSRISQSKIQLHTQRVNLVALVQQAVEGMQAQFEQQGKALQVSLPTAAIEVEGDATRLTQVVTNLLTNGLRYSGEHGQVWVKLTHQRNEAILQVRDNGIGLATDQLSAIFELFVQVDNSAARSKGGLGLGLTLVKRLVEMHGGRVEASSAGVGQGSTFTVQLPTLTSAVEGASTPTPQPADSAAAGRILVIDDNADAGFTLAMLLKLKGYETHSRTSGRAGLEAAEALQPGAILLDIGMPDLDGYATCRLIREQTWGQAVVVIALTGYGQEDDRQRTQGAGFDGHLVKPVDLGVLTTLLTDLLEKRRNQ